MKLFSRSLTSISMVSILFASSLYAADSAGISGTVKTLGGDVAQKHVNLKEGWNLVGINSDLTLEQLKSKLGNDNILVINGQGSVYRKGSTRVNFKKFEQGKGYYIKLAQAKSFDYDQMAYANKTISLVSGWNQINPLSELSLDAIKNQQANNLTVISGAGAVFRASGGRSNFTKFTEPHGYMIKVAQDSVLQF